MGILSMLIGVQVVFQMFWDCSQGIYHYWYPVCFISHYNYYIVVKFHIHYFIFYLQEELGRVMSETLSQVTFLPWTQIPLI